MKNKKKITLSGLDVDSFGYMNKMQKKVALNTSVYINGGGLGLTASESWYSIVKPLKKFAQKNSFLTFTLSVMPREEDSIPRRDIRLSSAMNGKVLFYNNSRLHPFDLDPLLIPLNGRASQNKNLAFILCAFLNSEGHSFENYQRNNRVRKGHEVEDYVSATEYRLHTMKWVA